MIEGSSDEPDEVSVFLGYDWDKGVCENTREEIGRVIIHPDHDLRPKGSIPDAALVEILQPAAADPVKLLTPEEEALYAPAGATATVIGGGRQGRWQPPPYPETGRPHPMVHGGLPREFPVGELGKRGDQ